MKSFTANWDPKSLKKKKPAPYNEEFTDEELEKLEEEFIATYVRSEVKPLRMLLKIYKRYWKELLAALFFYVIKHSPVILLPIVTSYIINFVAYPGEYSFTLLVTFVVLILALLILNIPMNTLYTKCYCQVMRKVEAGLRGAMVRKLQQLSISFHKEMQSGRIQSKLMRDVETVHTLSSQLFVTIPALLLNAGSAMIIVVSKNLTVFSFFLICIPTSILLARFFKAKMEFTNKDYRVNMEKTSASLMDMVVMTEITRAHALEDKEIKKLSLNLKDVANSGLRVDVTQSKFGACSWAITQIFQLGCLIFSSVLAFNSIIQVGDISLYQSYFSSITGQISSFLSLLPIITKGLDSVSSIGEILSATDIEDNTDKIVMPELKGEYEFKNVSFSYDANRKLLDGLSIKIKAGETIAFVGESGCGKTTTLNLVLGFYLATSGQVTVDGKDIKTVDLHSYRSHIAIVPQNSVLFTGTIRENITYGVENVTEKDIAEAIDAARLTDFINSLPDGINTMLTEHGANLSGGQRQRISIARAIIRKPSVIIFDEATSALDSVSEREIQRAIDNLTANRTTFIVAHRLSTIRNADRIAVLKNGKCEELGSYEQLMEKKGLFYQMQTMQ